MGWQWSLGIVLEIAAVVIINVAVYFVIKLHLFTARITRTAIFLTESTAIWMLAHSIEIGSTDLLVKEFSYGLQLTLVVTTASIWLAFSYLYLNPEKKLSTQKIALLSIVPVATLILSLTNRYHGLIWTDITPGNTEQLLLTFQRGIGWYFCAVYAYIVFLSGLGLLIQRTTTMPEALRADLGLLALGGAIIIVLSIADVLDVEYRLQIPLSPTAWGAATAILLFLFGVKYIRIANIAPVARAVATESISKAIIVLDMNNHIVDMNPAGERLIGYTIKQAFGKPLELLASDWLAELPINKGRNKYGQISKELLKTDNGKLNYYHVTNNPVQDSAGNVIGQVIVVRDTTDYRQAEEALRKSEAQYRSLIEHAIDGIVVIQDNEIKFANPIVSTATGYSREELKSMSPSHILHPDDIDTILSLIRNTVVSGITYNTSNFRIMTRSGETRWVEANIIPVIWDGKPATLNFLRDYTEHMKAEQSLKESEEKFRLTFESVNDGIIVTDLQMNIALVNEAGVHMLRYDDRKELIGRNALEFIATSGHDTALQDLQKIQEISYIRYAEYKMLTKDRQEFDAELSADVIRDSSDRPIGIVAVARDITRRKQEEKDLVRTQKLESLGILAGGIAHDFNNFLTAILANLIIAKSNLTNHDEISTYLSQAEKAAVQATYLTQQLLDFSKSQSPTKDRASIIPLLRDTAAFILSGSNVKYQINLVDNLYDVNIDEGQIIQVISNLLINAKQAMLNGGTIQICAENIWLSAEQGYPVEDGWYVKISIIDQGIGIAEEHLQNIFDPYFTTKPNSSGLGLATSYSIVKGHGGFITASSKTGIGSTFQFYLPALSVQDHEKAVTSSKSESTLIAKGKILVVDDMEDVRLATVGMLRLAGFDKIESCADERDAILIYKKAKEYGDPFDVVILDMTIPGGLGSKEALEELCKIDQNVKVIISSGYGSSPIMSDFKKYGFCDAISKPYTVEELANVVSRVLTGTK